jgi:hypothetical protein
VPAPTPAERLPFDLDATRRLIAQENERFTNADVTGDIATIDSMFTPTPSPSRAAQPR